MFVTLARRRCAIGALCSKPRPNGQRSECRNRRMGWRDAATPVSPACAATKGPARHVAEPATCGCGRRPNPRRSDGATTPPSCGAGALVGAAVLVIAGRVEDAHADRRQPVGRDDRAECRPMRKWKPEVTGQTLRHCARSTASRPAMKFSKVPRRSCPGEQRMRAGENRPPAPAPTGAGTISGRARDPPDGGGAIIAMLQLSQAQQGR